MVKHKEILLDLFQSGKLGIKDAQFYNEVSGYAFIVKAGELIDIIRE